LLAPVIAFANTRDRICLNPSGKLVSWDKHDGEQELDESFSEALVRQLSEQREYKEQLRAAPLRRG